MLRPRKRTWTLPRMSAGFEQQLKLCSNCIGEKSPVFPRIVAKVHVRNSTHSESYSCVAILDIKPENVRKQKKQTTEKLALAQGNASQLQSSNLKCKASHNSMPPPRGLVLVQWEIYEEINPQFYAWFLWKAFRESQLCGNHISQLFIFRSLSVTTKIMSSIHVCFQQKSKHRLVCQKLIFFFEIFCQMVESHNSGVNQSFVISCPREKEKVKNRGTRKGKMTTKALLCFHLGHCSRPTSGMEAQTTIHRSVQQWTSGSSANFQKFCETISPGCFVQCHRGGHWDFIAESKQMGTNININICPGIIGHSLSWADNLTTWTSSCEKLDRPVFVGWNETGQYNVLIFSGVSVRFNVGGRNAFWGGFALELNRLGLDRALNNGDPCGTMRKEREAAKVFTGVPENAPTQRILHEGFLLCSWGSAPRKLALYRERWNGKNKWALIVSDTTSQNDESVLNHSEHSLGKDMQLFQRWKHFASMRKFPLFLCSSAVKSWGLLSVRRHWKYQQLPFTIQVNLKWRIENKCDSVKENKKECFFLPAIHVGPV